MFTYRTVAGVATSMHRAMASKHLGYLVHVRNEDEVKTHLEQLRREHPQAHHVCYAWRLGWNKSLYRFNDDGEPSGTAGKPIYGQLLSADLTYVLLAVVRYFGGTKLGTGGLIDAYKTAASEAIRAANIIEKEVQDYYRLEFEYQHMPPIMNLLKQFGAARLQQDLQATCFLITSVPSSRSEAFLNQINKTPAKVSFIERN